MIDQDINLFKPARRFLGLCTLVVFAALLVNAYYLISSKHPVGYITLVLLFLLFLYLFFPLIKNQKLIISGDKLIVLTYGKHNTLTFSANLHEILVKGETIISYRFEKDGQYFQISPSAYEETEEVETHLKSMMKRAPKTISVVTLGGPANGSATPTPPDDLNTPRTKRKRHDL